MSAHVGEPPSAAAGLMYGIGLGGFVDGIVLHQILQWHHMASSTSHSVRTVAGLEVNTRSPTASSTCSPGSSWWVRPS